MPFKKGYVRIIIWTKSEHDPLCEIESVVELQPRTVSGGKLDATTNEWMTNVLKAVLDNKKVSIEPGAIDTEYDWLSKDKDEQSSLLGGR